MGLQRERVVGAAVALVAVLLALPSVLAPTWHMSISDRERGALLSEQWEWSWGRSRLTGLAGVELQDLWNLLGLTIFVLLLVLAVAGVALWARGGSGWTVVAGFAGVAALAGRLVTTSAERHGRALREEIYGASGLTMVTDTPRAGVLESAAAAVLLVALALMALTLAGGDRLSFGVLWGRAGAPGPAGRHTSGVADEPSVTAALRPEGEHLSSAPVAFGDAAEEDRER